LDIRFGISESAREIDIEAEDSVTQEEIEKMVSEAIASDQKVLWLSDRKGRRVGIPVGRISYVEIGPNKTERRVGFALT
jgi:hypothetical protein